jgi:hypothetical protein
MDNKKTFDELYPHAAANTAIIVIEHDGVPFSRLALEGRCWNCGQATHWVGLAFEDYICSPQCFSVKWGEYMQALTNSGLDRPFSEDEKKTKHQKHTRLPLYILRDGIPVPEPDLLAWAEWFENADHIRVAFSKVGEVDVSTVFLGFDLAYGIGAPKLFETMLFGGPDNQRCIRYSTLEAAMRGHEEVVVSEEKRQGINRLEEA